MRYGSGRRDTAQVAVPAANLPRPRLQARPREDLLELFERATRRQVTLVQGPGGIGKTLACSTWAATQLGAHVVWLTLRTDEDQSLFWARVYHGLLRAAAAPAEILQDLADATAAEFPLWLAHTALSFARPVVLVVDNAHAASSRVLAGLDMLLREAPPTLRVLLAGRHRPQLRQLERLQAAGNMAIIGPADLCRRAVPDMRGGV